MKKNKLLYAILTCALSFSFHNVFAGPRTFISASGVDTGTTCGLVAPCRSINYALANTSSGGEVIILNSGTYGTVGQPITISQSVNIKAPSAAYAGVGSSSASGGNAIIIDGVGIKVTLTNLQIIGSTGGNVGIKVVNADVVHVIDSIVSNMAQYGIQQQAGSFVLVNSAVNFNNIGINSSSATGAVLKIMKSHVSNNTSDGVLVGNGVDSDINDSFLDGNGGYGININASTPSGVTNGSVVTTDNTEMIYNNAGGARVFDSGAKVAKHDGANLWLLRSKIRQLYVPGFINPNPALTIEGPMVSAEISHSIIGGGFAGGPVISITDPALSATTSRDTGYMHLYAHLGTNQVFGNGGGNPDVYLNGTGCSPTFLNNNTEPTCGVDTNGAGSNPF